MAIKTITVEGAQVSYDPPLIFKEMPLAHQWCTGRGVELGAAAHNPFNLDAKVVNVAPYSDDPEHPDYADFDWYRSVQVGLCGAYAKIDRPGTATDIPAKDGSLDFVISSHVIEHEPNPIKAFFEFNRVLKPGGIVFMIFPKPDALPADQGRPLTQIGELLEAFEQDMGPDGRPIPENQGRRGHYNVWDLQAMLDLIAYLNLNYDLNWEVVETEATDSKVGNGQTVVARYSPVTSSRGTDGEEKG